MNAIKSICIASFLFIFTAHLMASEIIRGITLADGQQLYASDLHALIDDSTIGVQFYNDQQTVPVLNSGYYFLVLDPANQVYRRISAQQVLYGNTNIYLDVSSRTPPVYGSVMFYDPTNQWLAQTTVSNLFNFGSSNINVSYLQFASTNNAGGTNQFILPQWTLPFSGMNTNFPLHILIFDTNGIPYRFSLTNLELNLAGDLGTNFSVPYLYNWQFYPWTFYNTNSWGFTNNWGYTTNFPIKSLFVTNGYPASTNSQTLVDSDQIPINSTQQETNTTTTLQALFQYLQNKNTLPPYTFGRIQFSGYPISIIISNDSQTSVGLLHVAFNSFPTNIQGPYAVSVITNASQIQVQQFQTNTIFYVQTQSTNTAWVHVYSNYLSAVQLTNWIPVFNSGAGTMNQFLYLTNFTSYNADAIPVVAGPTTIRTGIYDIYFRTPAATAPYYLSGTVEQNQATLPYANWTGSFNLANDNILNTNFCRIYTHTDNNGAGEYPLVQVLVNPQ
ncbi:MAG: hypothetical protein KGL39_50575 [Patescibacteria group bacterium]|nr:hypothetical protein [Patescibacteria group bacterium]